MMMLTLYSTSVGSNHCVAELCWRSVSLCVQLHSNALVSRSGSLYGVVHVCSHGILFPRTVWVASARYYLDDPLHRRAPIGESVVRRATATARHLRPSLAW
jgi:hypothetical protein